MATILPGLRQCITDAIRWRMANKSLVISI
jgi:hypothetical protein